MKQRKPGFDIGFDEPIGEPVREELRRFVRWVEANYEIPVTFWVDFEYRHYLVSRDGKRVGYLFYWDDDATEIPMLRLPVRTEKSTMVEILGSFAQGVADYFTWLRGDVQTGEGLADEMLAAYLRDNPIETG